MDIYIGYRHLQENQNSSGLQIEVAYKTACGLKMSVKCQQSVNADSKRNVSRVQMPLELLFSV